MCYDSLIEVVCQAADGSGQAQVLFKVDGLTDVRPISPDGTRMLLSAQTPRNGDGILMAMLGTASEARALIQTPYSENGAAISPDGRWLAYDSNESGRTEVYVRPFPAVDQGRWQISTEGGREPRWARNGHELFFTTGGGAGPRALMSVVVTPGSSSFAVGKPAVVMKFPSGLSSAYDVAPDGRFLFHVPASNATAETSRQQIVVVQHWFDELKARVATAASSR